MIGNGTTVADTIWQLVAAVEPHSDVGAGLVVILFILSLWTARWLLQLQLSHLHPR